MQAPALRQVRLAVGPHAADVERHVDAQPVDVVLLQPHQGVVADELAHLGAAVVRAGCRPRASRAPVVVEVDAAAVVLAPAVEPPQVEVARAEVVVDDVEDDREPVAVGLADELLERLRARRRRSRRRRCGPGCSPTSGRRRTPPPASPGGVDAELLQVVEPADDVAERARAAGLRVRVVERADVQFVDDQLVPRRRLVVLLAPVEVRVVDDARCRPSWSPRGRRGRSSTARPTASSGEAVLVADLRAGHVGVPVALVVLAGQRVLAPRPSR